jgi:hypothetical protein
MTNRAIMHPWTSATILFSIIISVLTISVFVVYGKQIAPRPMIAFYTFHDRTALSGLFSFWADGIVLWKITYFTILQVSFPSFPRHAQIPHRLPYQNLPGPLLT